MGESDLSELKDLQRAFTWTPIEGREPPAIVLNLSLDQGAADRYARVLARAIDTLDAR